MANARYADQAPLSALFTRFHMSLAARDRVRELVEQWCLGRDTVAEIRSIYADAARFAAGEQPECDRAAVRWQRALDASFDDIDRALTRMRQ